MHLISVVRPGHRLDNPYLVFRWSVSIEQRCVVHKALLVSHLVVRNTMVAEALVILSLEGCDELPAGQAHR